MFPVTLDKTTLHAKLEDGTVVSGEHGIDALGQDWTIPIKKIVKCWADPKACVTKEVQNALERADYIIIGPGDLYTSLLPNFLVDGMAESVAKSPAKKIFVVNLMTKRGQTDNFTVKTFVSELKKYVRGLDLDYVLVNKGKIKRNVVEWYQKTCEVEPVINDLIEKGRTKIISADIVSKVEYGKTISDRIQRSLIRHDMEKLGKALTQIINIDMKPTQKDTDCK